MKQVLQRGYQYLPPALQNAAITAYGYLYRRERFGPAYEPTVIEFEERDRWDSDRLRSYVDKVVKEVLRRAYDAPFYRRHWTAAGLKPQHLDDISLDTLHRLPTLPKDEVRRNPYAFVPDRGRRVTGLLSYSSSGSTGTPIRAICTRVGQQRFAAAREVRSYRWAGTSIRRPRAMIGGQPIVSPVSPKAPYYRYNLAERQVYFSAYHISPATIADYVQGFDRFQPESVTGYAFSQYMVASIMLDQGLKFASPPVVSITSSEALTEPMRDVINRAWGCRAYQEYGSVENVALATECEAGAMHVSPDFGVVEIVDSDGYPVPIGTEGRMVCTALLNDAQFLVRYEIGDTAAWSGESCPCGRDHLPVIAELTGRLEDAIVSRDGRQLVRFHSIFINMPHVVQGQIIQESLDLIRVRVIADDEFGTAQAAEIRKRVTLRLGPVEVVVERVADLERTSRGKVRAVISQVPRGSGPVSA